METDFVKTQTLETSEYVYNGGVVNGMMDGKGEQKMKNGDTYIGQFKANKRHGKGKITYLHILGGLTYEGDFKDYKESGKGVLTLPVNLL